MAYRAASANIGATFADKGIMDLGNLAGADCVYPLPPEEPTAAGIEQILLRSTAVEKRPQSLRPGTVPDVSRTVVGRDEVIKRGNERRVRSPKYASMERRGSSRFALILDVRYTISGLGAPVETGSGSTMDLSSSGLSFTADRPLATGQKLHVSIDWPVLLDGRVQLQLIMSGVVVRTNGTATALQIRRHEFRTRRMGLKAAQPQGSLA